MFPPEPAGDEFREIGQQVTLWPLAKVVNRRRISLGNRVIIDDFVLLVGGEDTVIGDFVHIAAHSSIVGGGRLRVHDFAGISGGVRLYTGNEQYGGECMTNPTVPAPYRVPERGSIVIEKHAIIGANSVILPGVTVGQGAVVGACSLVTRDCAPWTVNFGSPARTIGMRPSAEILRLEQELRSRFYSPTGAFNPHAT